MQSKYHIATIDDEDKRNGFVTTLFTNKQLENLVKIKGLFIAKDKDTIIAYAMAAAWTYWEEWPMFQFMVQELPKLRFDNQTITKNNSYQYGPICIDKEYRGIGVLENLFSFVHRQIVNSQNTPIMVTFINKINPRSYKAHTQKCMMTKIHEFEFNDNSYYELAFKD